MTVSTVEEEVGRRGYQRVDEAEHRGHSDAVLTHLLLTKVDLKIESGGCAVQLVLDLRVQETARAVVIGESELQT